MKPTLYFAFTLLSQFFFANAKINAQAPGWLWCKSMGGISDDDAEYIALDPSGNGDIYMTGNFYGNCDFDPGEDTFNLPERGTFISKLDASGNFLWAKGLGGTGYFIEVNSIAIDPGVNGGVYITGWFYGTADFDPGTDSFNLTSKADGVDIFISKLDSSGNFQWAKAFGGSGEDEGISIAIDPSGNGNLYVTGYFEVTADFNPGSETFYLHSKGEEDIFISKFSSSGNLLWAKSMGGTQSDHVTSLTINPTEKKEIYIAGIFSGSADLNPGSGISTLTASGLSDIFISKLDSTGNFVWSKAISGTQIEGLNALVIDSFGNGNIYIAGWFRDTIDLDPGPDNFKLISEGLDDSFIGKLDASGNLLWAKQIKSPFLTGFSSLAIDQNGDIYTTGSFEGFVDFDLGEGYSFLFSDGGYFDIFITKLDPSGNFQWAKSSSGGDFNIVGAMAIDAFGYVHIVGSFDGLSFSLDSITLINSGINDLSDIFIAKLDKLTTSVDHNNFELQSMILYPNPVTSTLTIQSGEAPFSETDIAMYNTLGKLMYFKSNQNISDEITIDISALAPGIYFIVFDMEGNRVVKKVMKE